MTVPTQPQIEAAINAMLTEWVKEAPNRIMGAPAACWAEIGMTAALTAAAEAGSITCLDIKLATECAVAATIQRCAQVCDDGTESGEFYAAKIRALKGEG